MHAIPTHAEPSHHILSPCLLLYDRRLLRAHHGDAAMQQRSSSAGLTIHLLLFVLAIAGISAGFSVRALGQTPPSVASAERYILGPTDRIRLKVYGEPDISGEYEIDGGGQVSIPLAGHIKAAGATT